MEISRRACAGPSLMSLKLPMEFPAGLRVLVVDDDPLCLRTVERLLWNCHYDVTTCPRADTAISMVRERKGGFDLILSDVHMPDMDGFKLLELIGLETDLPVIMISADDGKDVVMKGVTNGAVDYLVKPVRIEAVKIMWQHVVRKSQRKETVFEHTECVEEKKVDESGDDTSSEENDGGLKNGKRKNDENDGEDEDEQREDSPAPKKPRVVWSRELHQTFVSAVNQLGIDKAVPKKILEIMDVPGITRENVASHLQKYRLFLKKNNIAGDQKQLTDGTRARYTPVNSVSHFDFQGPHIPGQHMLQNQMTLLSGPRQLATTGRSLSLLDRMNRFNSNAQTSNNTSRIVPWQQSSNNRRMNTESRQSQQVLQPNSNLGLQETRGTSSFLNCFPISTSFGFNLTTSSAYPINSIQQNRQSDQFQQQNNFDGDTSTRGRLMDGVAGEIDDMLLPNICQQITTPNSNVRATSVPETLLPSSYGPASQTPCVGDNYTNASAGDSFLLPTSMATQNISVIGMFGETVSPMSNNESLDRMISWKGEDDFAPNLRNRNRNSSIVNNEVMPNRMETTDCNKITGTVQESSTNVFPNELMNVVSNQFLQQEDIGAIDADFNYDTFSMDDILNDTPGPLQM